MRSKALCSRFSVACLAIAALWPIHSADAQKLSPDQEKQIKIGTDLIRLGCGTGTVQEKTQVGLNADASLTLKKLPGVTAGGDASYSKTEAQALAASLQSVISKEGVELSQSQIACMKPYIDTIFAMVFPKPEPAPVQDKTGGQAGSDAPVSMTLLAGLTRPLDGFTFDQSPVLPARLTPGPILPGGGRTRVVLQVASASQVAQIDRVSVEVVAYPPTPELAYKYSIDPLRQSGFGAARPRQFTVKLNGAGLPQVFYITDQNKSLAVPAANILPKVDFPILELDSHSGLQEALDVNIVPDSPGFYQVTFVGNATSGGHEYVLRTAPLYIVRH
jgi:hypothetical protein